MKKEIRKIVVGLGVALAGITLLAGCHTVNGTVHGAGQDMQALTNPEPPPPPRHRYVTKYKKPVKYRHHHHKVVKKKSESSAPAKDNGIMKDEMKQTHTESTVDESVNTTGDSSGNL